jgi:hypothetical protein
MEQVPQRAGAGAENVFETTDFYLACVLRPGGFRLVGLRREGPRSVFRFEDRVDREEVMLAFFNNEGNVHRLAFSAAIKDIKDIKALIYNL